MLSKYICHFETNMLYNQRTNFYVNLMVHKHLPYDEIRFVLLNLKLFKYSCYVFVANC